MLISVGLVRSEMDGRVEEVVFVVMGGEMLSEEAGD